MAVVGKTFIKFYGDEEGRVWMEMGNVGRVVAEVRLEDAPHQGLAELVADSLNWNVGGWIEAGPGEHPLELSMRYRRFGDQARRSR